MKINPKSMHYRYFLFLKRMQIAFLSITDFPQSDPFSHYVYYNKITWGKKIIEKFELNESLFKYHDSFLQMSKLLLKRLLIYQLWGSLIIIILVKLFNNYILMIPDPFQVILGGVLPMAYIILILGLIHGVFEYLRTSIHVIRGKEFYFKRVRQVYTNIFAYIFFILLAPFLFFIYFFLESFSRFIISFIHYQVIGTRLFIELIWLFINLIIVLLSEIYSVFINIKNKFKPNSEYKSVNNFFSIEIEDR